MIRRALSCLFALLAVGSHALVAQSRRIDRVAWLTGCWITSSPRRTIEERWMPPRGNTMIGVGRTVRGDSLVEYEVVVLREGATRLVYEAHPSGQAPALFLADSGSDSSVVFENAAHDFPQRVGYRRVGTDSLVAWVEGPMEGQNRRIEFPYRRTDCTR